MYQCFASAFIINLMVVRPAVEFCRMSGMRHLVFPLASGCMAIDLSTLLSVSRETIACYRWRMLNFTLTFVLLGNRHLSTALYLLSGFALLAHAVNHNFRAGPSRVFHVKHSVHSILYLWLSLPEAMSPWSAFFLSVFHPHILARIAMPSP